MSEYTIRPYERGEEQEIVDLLSLVFNGWPNRVLEATPLEHWIWKYPDNPNKPFSTYVVLHHDTIVGVGHSTAVPIKYMDSVQTFTLGSDAAVHPDHRRKGIRNKFVEKKSDELRSKGVKLTYSVTRNPILLENHKKTGRPRFPLPITNYVRILDLDEHLEHLPMKNSALYRTGYSTLEKLQKLDNVLRPIPELDETITLDEIFSFDDRFDTFWHKILANLRFAVSRDSRTLNYKYCDPINGQHRIIAATDTEANVLGYVVTFINKKIPDYPIGYIIDLVGLPQRRDVVNSLLEIAVSHIDDMCVNTCLALSVQGHPYNRVFKNNGFLDSRFPLHLYLMPLVSSFDKNELASIKSHEVLFSFGDIDSLPTSF